MWWVTAALAAPTLGPEDFDRLVQGLVPVVGQAAGRPLVDPVRTGIVSRAELATLLREPPPYLGDHPPLPRPPTDAEAAQEQLVLQHALAVYLGSEGGIYLIADAVDDLFDQFRIDPAQLRPVVRCLAAHELVHALQDQYGTTPTDLDEDRLRGWLALREGQATLVGMEVCRASEGDAIARLAETFAGVAVPGTVDPDDTAAPYALGRRLAADLRAEDPELVWAADGARPPSWSAIVHDVRPALGGGWEDPAPLEALLDTLGRPGVHLEASPPANVSALLGIRDWMVPEASAGWAWKSDQGDLALAAFRLDQAGVAADLLRRRQLRLAAFSRTSGNAIVVMTPARTGLTGVVVGRRTALEHDGRHTLAAVFRGPGWRADEEWVATDHVLVLLGVYRSPIGRRALDPVLDTLVTRLDGLEPSAVTWDALADWHAQVRDARTGVVAVTSPGWRTWQAARGWRDGDHEPCAAAFGDALDAGRLADPAPWQRSAYRCAVAAAELPTAGRLARLLTVLEPEPAAIHAAALLELHRAAEAEAVLERVGPTDDPDVRSMLGALHLRALVETKRWDDLVAAARREPAPPEARAAAGTYLRNAGRTQDAREVLAGACPALTPPPAACRVLSR